MLVRIQNQRLKDHARKVHEVARCSGNSNEIGEEIEIPPPPKFLAVSKRFAVTHTGLLQINNNSCPLLLRQMREVTKVSYEGRIVLGSESKQFLSRL
jgi:hypothetical protein